MKTSLSPDHEIMANDLLTALNGQTTSNLFVDLFAPESLPVAAFDDEDEGDDFEDEDDFDDDFEDDYDEDDFDDFDEDESFDEDFDDEEFDDFEDDDLEEDDDSF